MHFYNNNNIEVYKSLINKMSGFISIHDLESKFILANDNASKAMGLKSTYDIAGMKYSNMRCKASEDAETFEAQDKLVFTVGKKVTFLSYFQYSDGWKLGFGEKSPLVDDHGKLIGLTCYITDITNCNLVDVSRFISTSIQDLKKLNNKKFSYIIADEVSNRYLLSSRQLECLFFY